VARFLKIVLSSRIGNSLIQKNQRTRITRWLGREIVVAGLPPLVCVVGIYDKYQNILRSYLSLILVILLSSFICFSSIPRAENKNRFIT